MKMQIQHIHPGFWFANMKWSKIQIMLHGVGIGTYDAEIQGDGVALTEVIHTSNNNYLILYVETAGAPAQVFQIRLKDINGNIVEEIPYELREREFSDIKTFDAHDVIYLILPDRWADGTSKDLERKKRMYSSMRDKVWDKNANHYDTNGVVTRHGGDIAGMIEHLDYFVQLGVTALWPTPLLENDTDVFSFHGYNPTDLYAIDPRFGTIDEYKTFVRLANAKGLKVIQDQLFNHISDFNFLWADRISQDWFTTDDRKIVTNYKTYLQSDRHAAQNDKDKLIGGCFVSCSPAVNGKNKLVQDYYIQNSLWWIEYTGVNGVRMDTYPYNDYDEMARWCQAVEAEHPGYNIVGETFMKSPIAISYWQKDSPVSDRNSHLPSVMDFPLYDLLQHVCDEETDEWYSGFSAIHQYLADDRVYADPKKLMTFLSNHDTNRFTTSWEQGSNNVRYKQALTLLLTLRGIPQLYYGDEICMVGTKDKYDFYQRQNFPGGFPGDFVNIFHYENMHSQMWEYYNFTRRMLQWRKRENINRIIAEGDFVQYCPDNGVYVYARFIDDKYITIMLNGTWQSRTVDYEKYTKVLPKAYARDFLSGRYISTRKEITMNPRDIFIFDWS